MVDITTVVDAALAPLAQPLGWQGFAYGLLGLRTMRRIVQWARTIFEPRTRDESSSNNDE